MNLRLEYFSCLMAVLSTFLVGRRMRQGWVIASANSALICIIALCTAQFGFVPANAFCRAIYGYNIIRWRSSTESGCTTGRFFTSMTIRVAFD